MFKPWTSPESLDDALRQLAADVTVYDLDGAWLVVARRGLMVFTADTGDLEGSALDAAERADAVRLRLSHELAWVPFVDAVCVTSTVVDPEEHADHPCLVITPDMVSSTVGGAPIDLEPEVAAALVRLRHRRLGAERP